jgi:uncharacterized protein YijF (DUF1287 family)
MVQVYDKMIVGELVENMIFNYELGDKLVECGLMSHLVIRNYQIWRTYRVAIPKDIQEDMERKKKGIVVRKIMKDFRLKNKKTLYDAVNAMESEV